MGGRSGSALTTAVMCSSSVPQPRHAICPASARLLEDLVLARDYPKRAVVLEDNSSFLGLLHTIMYAWLTPRLRLPAIGRPQSVAVAWIHSNVFNFAAAIRWPKSPQQYQQEERREVPRTGPQALLWRATDAPL
jgi:hypothetical protein